VRDDDEMDGSQRQGLAKGVSSLTLICLTIANVSRPDRNILLAKHSSQFLVQQDLSLERLVVLVFSATEDDHAELGIGSDASEKLLVRASVKVRQLIEVDRGGSVIFP
jgi:hypothetical protein